MFSAIIQKIKEILQKMNGAKTVEQALHITPIISSAMNDALELWSDMYEDKSPWLHEPTFANPSRVVSLGLPAFIASEKARLATIEMHSEITTPNPKDRVVERDTKEMMDSDHIDTRESEVKPSPRVEFLNKTYQEKVISNLRNKLEYGVALGGMIIKPYVVLLDEELDGVKAKINVDFVPVSDFYPISFTINGEITEAAFVQSIIDKDTVYRRIEYHKLEGSSVIIKNTVYMSKNTSMDQSSNNANLGQEVPLDTVADWKDLAPEVKIDNVDGLLFAYFKMPEANTVDKNSPLGMSAYGRAVNLIRDADEQYSRLLWEFEATEAAIDIDRDALKPYEDANGVTHSIRPMLQERLFRRLDLGADDTYQPFLPQIRDNSLINGLNTILTRIEDVCALSRGTISTVISDVNATSASELKILKQRSYSVNADIQKALENTLKRVIKIMDTYCTLYNIVPEAEYEVSFEWDDSILVDIDAELSKRMRLVQYGVYSKVELRMWYFGETKEQARQALKIIEDENKKAIIENAKLQQEAGMQLNTLQNNQKFQQDVNGTDHEKVDEKQKEDDKENEKLDKKDTQNG